MHSLLFMQIPQQLELGMSLPTGSNHNCPLRGTTQQPMERDAEMQPNIRWISGNPAEEDEKGLQEPEWLSTPGKHGSQNQLSRVHAHSRSQRLKQQSCSLYGSVLGSLHICYRSLVWYFCGTPNSEIWDCLWLCYLPLDPLPLTRLPGCVSLGENVLSPAETGCPRMGWYSRQASISWGEEERVIRRGIYKGRIWRKEGRELQ